MPFKKLFRQELEFLRQSGHKFAQDNPGLTHFLGENAHDPDVERLLEGTAFLTAKLGAKLEADFPELIHSLLQMLWPNYLRPIPSMTTVHSEATQVELTKGKLIPRGTRIQSEPVDGIPCEYRTCHDLWVWPFDLTKVDAEHSRERSVMRAQLSLTSQDLPLDALGCDALQFHLSGDDTTAQTLYLWLAHYLEEVHLIVGETSRRLRPDQLKFAGFDPEDALLPYPQNVFDGYRVLQEYFVFPQRFFYFSLTGLRRLWPAHKATQFTVEFRFKRPMPVDIRITDRDLSLHCTPAVNLFTHDAQPMDLNGRAVDQLIVPSGPRPDAYEIFSVDEVTGWARDIHGKRGRYLRTYPPFESLLHEIEHSHGRNSLYQRTRIERAYDNEGLQHRIAFVRADDADYIGENETVSLTLTCTNRDLPLSLGIGDIHLSGESTASQLHLRNISVPTPSYRPSLDGELLWTLLSNLSLNYLSLLSVEPMKAVLRAYDFAALHDIRRARASQQRLNAIVGAETAPIDRLIRGLPVRGMRTRLKLDQAGFLCEGDLFLFGTVLSHFFALYASINSFHVLEVVNTTNNETYTWPMHTGVQPLI
ncbi:type VI secretion system baseplate subunit TssF [Cupriavidus basilensis]|uniref:Type VI secretion system baseplate subunit TssF n=1 Tax=Cupriavidus basilensis TaxID=68895 RepID=A0ABT6AFU1_9BURK|nr:type VI secretion system baseplate subunit TssF [Cupriavidus basilensis]MDF3831467.1 type VI secretion system baseplate subunit TssF [Cupriavidus basilensis]